MARNRTRAAGRGPCTAAHETAENQDEARQHGPVGIVTDGQSRRGGIADYVEGRIQEGLTPGGVHALQLQRDGRQDGTACQAEQEKLQHRVVERTERPGHESHVQQAEMQRCQDHEDDREHGDERGMEIAYGQVMGREPARRTNAESVVNSVECIHAGRPETQESQGEEGEIYPRKDGHGLVGPGLVILPGQR